MLGNAAEHASRRIAERAHSRNAKPSYNRAESEVTGVLDLEASDYEAARIRTEWKPAKFISYETMGLT